MYDVVVIGGGPAGYVGAIKAAQLGAKVAIVEKDEYGGTCLNRGCIPTKTYVKNAELIHGLKELKARGVNLGDDSFEIDMKKIVSYKNRVVRKLTGGVGFLLESHGIDKYKGVGTITKDKKVKIDSGEILETKTIILAGGSTVSKMNIKGSDDPKVMTSDEILDLKEIPKRLAIVGGGVIGCEMATIFNAYGSEVTIVQSHDRLLNMIDEELSDEIMKAFKKSGIKMIFSSHLEEMENHGDTMKLDLENDQHLEVDLVLLAVGRRPDLEGIGEIELEIERGAIVVNDKMETSVEGIYAPGDINGKWMLAHAASKMAEVAVINALGGDETFNPDTIPSCIYTIPEVSTIGLTENDAKAKYSNVSVGKFPFGNNGRALGSGEKEGFVKVITNRDDDKILGVHIVGVSAAEMINEAAALRSSGVTAKQLSEIMHAHPTYSESLMEAAADSFDECIHLPKK